MRIVYCRSPVSDLAVIVVSANSARWLDACLSSVYEHAGDIALDVVVADNASTDGTQELVGRRFPAARVVACENRGFAFGNNRAFLTVDAPFVLFLNPDTELLEGTLAAVVEALVRRPDVGLIGVRQVDATGAVAPTIRRFPSVTRTMFETLGSERLPLHAPWLGERELRPGQYEREVDCDWTSGSFMLARREAIESAGLMDERFFLYCEEPDLCLRMKQAGWKIRHVPTMTILHHGHGDRWQARFLAQEAYSRRLYMAKHFSLPRRIAGMAALAVGYAARAALRGGDTDLKERRRTATLLALKTLVGLAPPPFGEPPGQAVSTPPRPPSALP